MTRNNLVCQVSDNIRSARKSRGHTQDSLARELGLALRTVQGWEAGISLPSRKNLEALSEHLDHEPAWFYMVHDDEDETVAA